MSHHLDSRDTIHTCTSSFCRWHQGQECLSRARKGTSKALTPSTLGICTPRIF
ncbi:hypothetical protein Com2_42 [Cutibacterium phage CaCom2]|nr:hypothetical protein Com2_42 [Cutibacterium phage CaCom2]